MYQFKFWPELGHELAVQQANKQRGNQVDIRSFDSSNSFPLSFPSIKERIRRSAWVLLSGCIVLALSGCGGMTLNPSSVLASSTTTTSAALSIVSCGTGSLTGAQTKGCSVYLTASSTNPITVSLTSSNAALSVPTSVVVAAGAKTGGFTAVAAAVTKSVSVTITAKAGTVSKTDVITLYPAPTAGPTMSKLSCGTLTLTGPTTRACSVNISASATTQTVVKLVSSTSALQVPASVNVPAGATSAGFSVTASAVSTTVTATLTASANGGSQAIVLQLAGTSSTGSTQHEVQLSWDAPSTSTDPVVGYAVYRSTGSKGQYSRLNSALDTNTAYIDTSVQSALTYSYIVTSMDKVGRESPPSSPTSVTVP